LWASHWIRYHVEFRKICKNVETGKNQMNIFIKLQ